MEVNDDGSIHYIIPNRHKLAPHEAPPPRNALTLHRHHLPLALRLGRDANPLLAGVLSLVIPGAGQLYTGNIASAILWFVAVSAGYVLILPGLVLHILCILFAAASANRLNTSLARMHLLES